MENIKILFIGLIMLLLVTRNLSAQNTSDPLSFDADNFTEGQIELPTGEEIRFRAYEHIFYVANVIDSAYQTLNLYVPETAYMNTAPAIFLKTNVGGYMAAKASQPSATDATGRALKEGYVVVIPGSRGSNSTVIREDGSKFYTGVAPAGIVDLKAAIRYLRHNADRIPGDTERIITDGTSAGGAMSSLLGATGNHPAYEPYLKELEAADQRDDVFAAVCYCPIIDLEHADPAYEWFYQTANGRFRSLPQQQTTISEELAALYPAYLNSLGLKTKEAIPLTDANYPDYVKSFLIQSAQRARNEGIDIPEETGVKLNADRRSTGEFVVDIDMDVYLAYVIKQRALKTPPAFDAMNVAGNYPSPENNLFADSDGIPANFTDYGLRESTKDNKASIDTALKERVFLMNPMNFIGDGVSNTANHWYIRHGALDRDTALPVPVNLYTKLINKGYYVDFRLPWNRNHSGDYNLDDLFEWIGKIVEID